ncbi:MAG TPA: hypothetical protein VGX92_01165 [Pyrinomonadaceae bacterium]|nr:hypothetical protein [Pyrinomonadaceae bacterium]
MGEENHPNTNTEKVEEGASAAEPQEERLPEFIINKIKDELTFIDPASGKPITFKTRIIEEEEEEEEEHEPLSPDQFHDALNRIGSLGLTWTADLVPRVKAKSPETEEALVSEEFAEVQKKYPHLPYELYVATTYYLTGNKTYAQSVGGEEALKRKALIAHELLIDTDYRSEFFFKHAIKVPYLRDIDWEVVFKLSEKAVERAPAISYGLLALALQDPFYNARSSNVRHVTVAVDENLVNKLLTILNEVKSKLESGRRLSEILDKQNLLEAEDNGSTDPKRLE